MVKTKRIPVRKRKSTGSVRFLSDKEAEKEMLARVSMTR
jgi:hypothetical protein